MKNYIYFHKFVPPTPILAKGAFVWNIVYHRGIISLLILDRTIQSGGS